MKLDDNNDYTVLRRVVNDNEGDALGTGGVGPVAQRLVATGRVGFSAKW